MTGPARSAPAAVKSVDLAGRDRRPEIRIAIPKPAPAAPEIDMRAQQVADYGAARPGSVTTSANGPADAPPGSYQIVHETDAAHSTLATAQALPNVPFFGVIGTLGSEDSIDLFRMPISPGTVGLQFELVSQQQTPPTSVQFSLFDSTGQVVGTWSSSADPGASTINVQLSGQSLGPTLFLGISAASTGANGPAGPAPATAYQLWVTRLSAPDQQQANAVDVAGPLATSFLPFVVSSLPSMATATPPANAASPGVAPAPLAPIAAGPGAGLPQAVGGLPTRSASPLGGVLADGDPTPPAVRLSVSVNLAARIPNPAIPGHDPEGAPQAQAEAGRSDDPQAPVVLRGPGGFPLLGAPAIGNWRSAPTAVAEVPAEPASPDRDDPTAEDLLAVQDLPSQPAGPDLDGGAEDVPDASRPPLWARSRVTLSFGLSLATALTLNVVLSDPVAGFDYLATRLDPDARRPSRGRRPSTDPRGR